jgi:hypothetical protein
MKKLIIMVSSLAAAVFSTSAAKADVSVSGSYGFHMVSGGNAYNGATADASNQAGTNAVLMHGGGVAFALSTTTAGGMTVSAGAGITLDSNDMDNTTSATGLSAVTFAADGFSVTVGEIDLTAGEPGEVGAVASAVVDNGGYAVSAASPTGLVNTEGYGFNASTTVSGATVSFGYLWDYANAGVNNAKMSSGDYANGVSISMPVGAATVSLGMSSQSGTKDETATGGSIAMPVGGMTVKAGYASTDESTDSSTMSVAASGSLDADTTWAVGYSDGEQGTASSTALEAKLARSLGGGVSVYAEVQSLSGSVASGKTAGTNMAVGTTVAF